MVSGEGRANPGGVGLEDAAAQGAGLDGADALHAGLYGAGLVAAALLLLDRRPLGGGARD